MSTVPSAGREESQKGLQFFFAALLLVSFTSSLLFYLRRKKTDEEPSSRSLVPGPPGLPVIGNLHQIGELPHRSLHQLSLTYDPLLRLRLRSVTTLVVSSPALAREVFKTNDVALCSRPNLPIWRPLSYGSLEIALSPYSPRWVRTRRLFIVHFVGPRPIRGLADAREEEVRTLMSTVAAAAASGRAVDLSKGFMCEHIILT